MNDKHALLSASSAKRWLACPPSARLEEAHIEKYGEKGSKFSEEGDQAHTLAEKLLLAEKNEFSLNAFLEDYPDDMIYYAKLYRDFCMTRYNEIKAVDTSTLMLIEQTVDYGHVAPEGFGTLDNGIISKKLKVAVINDFKYGQGVKVDAVNNDQLRLYAEGFLKENDPDDEIETIELNIFQPRMDNISSWTISRESLNEWLEEIKPVAEQAFNGEGELKIGGHCQFCKFISLCPKQAELAQKLAKEDFLSDADGLIHPEDVEKNKLIDVFGILPILNKYLKELEDLLTKRAIEGEKFDGLKLISVQGSRYIADEEGVVDLMRRRKVKKENYLNLKIKGIGELEKAIGLDKKDQLNEFIGRKGSSLVLVPDTDPRPEYNPQTSAKDDFSEPFEPEDLTRLKGLDFNQALQKKKELEAKLEVKPDTLASEDELGY